MKDEATTRAVNFPILDVTDPRGVVRVANVHKNVPGVLGSINSIISEFGGNIVAQHLATDPVIGYLITDLEIKEPKKACEKISKLPTSLRTFNIS